MKKNIQKIKKAGLALLIVVFTSAAVVAQITTTVVINSIGQGWYTPSLHDASNTNYIVGYSGNQYRNYFAFNLSSIAGATSIVSATLTVQDGTCPSGTGLVNYSLWDVTTSQNTVVASQTSTIALNVYNDLGSGVSYGTFTESSNTVATRTFTLNGNALNTILANAGSAFTIGGSLVSPPLNAHLFGCSSLIPQQLTITYNSNSITTGTISPLSYCAGTAVSVPYTKVGTFNAGNVFTAQLSDASGSFATPTAIGTLSSTVSGTINATIPTVTPIGTGYRIRVVSSNPAITGTPNASDVTINQAPTITCPLGYTEFSDPGQCSAIVSFAIPATGIGTSVSYSPTSGSSFPIGTTTVTATASNACGTAPSCNFFVSVADNEGPAITVPASITVNNTPGTCGAAVSYASPTATDNCAVVVSGSQTISYTGSVQPWTVPAGVTSVTITAKGGRGGNSVYGTPRAGGYGASIEGTFTTTPGEQLNILVAGQGIDITNGSNQLNAGGGGGTFVWKSAGNVLLAAAGGGSGGGSCGTQSGNPGLATLGGSGTGGAGSSSCNPYGSGGGGAGWNADGSGPNNTYSGGGGQRPLNGGAGGPGPITFYSNFSSTPGGFGGGGGGGGNCGGGGGGGGYNGGKGGDNTACGSSYTAALGGTSYNIGTNQTNISGVNSGNGVVTISWIGNTNPSVTQTTGLPSGATFPVGTTTNTFTATDAAGNTSSESFDVTVVDNESPTITCPANISVPGVSGALPCTAPVRYAIPVGTDNCPGATTALIAGLPSGSLFPEGANTVTYEVTDAAGLTNTCSFTITVGSCNQPPVAICQSITVNADGNCEGTATAADVDNASSDPDGDVLTYSLSPAGPYALGNTAVTLTVTDPFGLSSSCPATITVEDATPPIISCPADIIITTEPGICGAVTNYATPWGTDNCSGATTTQVAGFAWYATFPEGPTTNIYKVTAANGATATCSFTVTVLDGEAPVADIATLANVTGECSASATAPTATDNCEGTITGTTTDPTSFSAQGTYTINWTYDDGNGNTSSQTQTVIVDDVTAPVADIATLADVTGECSVTATAPTATDNCEGTIIGTTTDPTSYSAQGTYTINWTYDDGNGNTSSQTQTVIVDDVTAPVADIATLANATGECSASATAPTATDNCEGSITGTTTDPTSYTAQGTYTINWTYDDGNGNASSQTQTVIVDDVTAPVADIATLADVTGECSATATAPTATDNCEGTIIGTTTDATSFSAQGTYTINWTYDDGNGNTSSQTQTVIVDDVTAPVADIATLADVTGECSATATAPTATDNCEGTITGTTTDATSFSAQGTYTINWTYDDGNGNTSSQTQTVIVDDVTPPTIACPANIVRNNDAGVCGAVVTYKVNFGDNCSGATVAQTAGLPTTAFFPVGTTTNTFVVTDIGGNTTSCSFDVTILDAENPTITCPANISAIVNASGCKATVNYSVTSADNCSGVLTQTAGLASGSPFPLGVTTNTFVVTDPAGNTATCSFTVTVSTTLAVNAGIDEQTFYGYTGDQTVTHNAIPSGGAGGYTYSWSLNRPLMCNLVNSAGDESFSGGTCTNNICPGSGSPSVAPVCSGSASVTAKLAQDADACVIVTDSKGCVATDCFHIFSEDARCFAGNINISKVTICHRTGSTTNPWVQICIANPAVPAHLAQNDGDYVGKCVTASAKTDEGDDVVTATGEFLMNVYPNPSTNILNVEFETPVSAAYQLAMFDNIGRKVLSTDGVAFADGNKLSVSVDGISPGIYYLTLNVGDRLSSVKVVVTK